MNKKFLIILCMTLQFSTMISASFNGSLSNWQAAFLAFAGGSDPVAAAHYVKGDDQINYPGGGKGSIGSQTSAFVTISALATNEAKATAQWMCNSTTSKLLTNSFTFSDVMNAINAVIGSAAPVQIVQPVISVISSQPPVVQPTTVTAAPVVIVQPTTVTAAPVVIVQPATVTAAPNATDSAAATLKSQIEAAKIVYNQYAPGTYTVTA